jgi:hypothetical protein
VLEDLTAKRYMIRLLSNFEVLNTSHAFKKWKKYYSYRTEKILDA